MTRLSALAAGLAVLGLVVMPSSVQAWDFEYDGDSTFQSKCYDGTGDPLDPSTWGHDPQWQVTAGENGAWEQGIGYGSGPGSWDFETVVSGGGALTPLGDPRYLFRNDNMVTSQWGARFGLVSAASDWTDYTWRRDNTGGTYPTATDPTHKFTLVFRMQNLGS